jgi:hypothetical protein
MRSAGWLHWMSIKNTGSSDILSVAWGKLGIAIYSTRPAAPGGIGRCMQAVVLDPGPATAS